MDFLTGFNNAIICILLIMIIHIFLVRSLPCKVNTNISTTNTSKELFIPDTEHMNFISNPPKCIEQSSDMTSEKDKLHEFVFGNSNIPYDEKNLDEFFKDVSKEIAGCKNNLQQEENEESRCRMNNRKDDHRIPLSTTCDPKLLEINTPLELSVKPHCNITKDIHILHEYNEENSMNSGQVFDDITAFDDAYLNFSEI